MTMTSTKPTDAFLWDAEKLSEEELRELANEIETRSTGGIFPTNSKIVNLCNTVLPQVKYSVRQQIIISSVEREVMRRYIAKSSFHDKVTLSAKAKEIATLIPNLSSTDIENFTHSISALAMMYSEGNVEKFNSGNSKA